MRKHGPKCAGCGKEIKPGEPAYQVRSGTVGEDGEFAREDMVSQHFHIGHCLCHDEHGCH